MNNTKPPSTPGVYCLWNKITNQIYVGSTTKLSARIKTHFSSRCQNLHLKGKSIEEWRDMSESGGGRKQVPLFLIDTGTRLITRIESSYEGERLGFGLGRNLSHYSKRDCLKRVKTCLVARSESEARSLA